MADRNKIVYGRYIFQDDDFKSGNMFLATSLLASQLQVNSFEATVRCTDPAILDFERNSKLTYLYNGRQRGIFYVQSIKRAGPELYEISATSTLGLLSEGQHMGGIYTGQTAEEVIANICGTVAFEIKHALKKIKLYGWLPIAAPRDNLAQVLFAIGAALKTDLDGVLRIEGLWDGISGQVPQDNMYTDASVDYSARITQVIVTEHQYVPWTEEKQLFEGTAQAGDVITFDEPMHDLVAQGFTIQASGANWARVSAGSGTLTGKTYIHNTRQVSKAVQEANTPNVKTVEDATLVSLVNSRAVAERLADYYRCRERVDSAVVYQGEAPGDRLATYHPFDKTGVAACLESADITLSNTLKAQEKLLVGYVPPQTGDVQYLDYREVLTGAGEWDPPEGVEEVRYVLFSGATGGSLGSKGGNSGSNKSQSYTDTSSNLPNHKRSVTTSFRLPGAGGKGGPGGEGGVGSRILEGMLTVTHGKKIPYNCGIGGIGGINGPGAEGTPTMFGDLTSADGTLPAAAGWNDVIGGEIYATKGATGPPGGDGAGTDPDYAYPDTSQVEPLMQYKPSTAALDHSGKSWPGATTMESKVANHMWHPGASGGYWASTSDGYAGATSGFGLGPGGVAGRTQSQPSSRGSYSSTRATAPAGITPPAPVKPDKAPPTKGGYGGYGGGGASSPGWAGIQKDNINSSASMSLNSGSVGVGGPGGPGGDGGDGMILLFYSKAEKFPAGQLVDKHNRMVLDRLGRRIIM